MRFTVLLLIISTICLAAAPEDLVSVSMRGTQIDCMPKLIDILAANPAENAQALIEQGGEINRGIPHSVLYRDVFYSFAAPDKWKLEEGTLLTLGDVIYTFFVDSKKTKDEFLKAYDLKPFGRMVDHEGHAPTLYVASPHHYVLVMMPHTVFTCSMHPKIKLPKEGRCPICSMDLLGTKVYR